MSASKYSAVEREFVLALLGTATEGLRVLFLGVSVLMKTCESGMRSHQISDLYTGVMITRGALARLVDVTRGAAEHLKSVWPILPEGK